MKTDIKKLHSILNLIVIPTVGLLILLLDLYAIYLEFNSTTEPVFKWLILILLTAVIPYYSYPFFEPVVNKLKNISIPENNYNKKDLI
jgi:uncharacterized protein YacL